MTKNQLAYWELQEQKRHQLHQDMELSRQNDEIRRHDTMTEIESNRHNVEQEKNWLGQLRETGRHNLATENLTLRDLSERVRHNKATEDLGYSNLSLGYSNLALGYSTLGESTRSHKANEALTERGQNVSVLNTGIRSGTDVATTLLSSGMKGLNTNSARNAEGKGLTTAANSPSMKVSGRQILLNNYY